ncbi:hypothetical protein [Streptomyces fungicidicus]|uniref:hypothetical protein n=1 Tax=Streptomyces fungicidicus TaxID=68203 RepID=UPI003698350E
MSALERLEEDLVTLEIYLRGTEGATDRAVETILRVREEITEEVQGKECPGPCVPAPAGMSRQEAVALAIQHVEKMATNARGYQNGDGLSAKTQAVATFVELLLGETTSSRE